MYEILEELNKTAGVTGSMIVGQDGINQSMSGMPRRRVHRQPSGLIHHQKVIILVFHLRLVCLPLQLIGFFQLFKLS